jgi:hypothetical protein
MEWISYNEEPPDKEWILVTDGIIVGLGFYDSDQGDFFGYNERKVRGHISHWMPLPKPPEEWVL